ncbi:uncharacterized protein LOC131936377 [Physella acuta]|uniref:uncharacterized protein LOC131936377 n=1 Tax=Physella acuta TaxID=109671 RepID=UPI0027DCD15D|nr:uncharacterized protein LOC131936377 [Physella acuta]
MAAASNYSNNKSCTHGNTSLKIKKLKVFIDFENVLCDFEGSLLKEYRKMYPKEPFISLEQRKGLNIKQQYAELGVGLGEKLLNIYSRKGFIRDLPEIPGSCEALQALNRMVNVEVFIYSSTSGPYNYCLKEKCQWVEEHLGIEWLQKIVFVKDLTLINCHVVIDDRVQIKGVNKPKWEHIVFQACHNTRSNSGNKRKLNNWVDGRWRHIVNQLASRLYLLKQNLKVKMASDSLIVLIDMDMVICDFEQNFLRDFRNKYPDLKYVPLPKRVGEDPVIQYSKFGASYENKVVSVYTALGFYSDLPEIPGACSALKELNEMEGVEVFIVSPPVVSYEFGLKEKCQWIDQHLGMSWVDRMVHICDKTLIHGHLLIDDAIKITGAEECPTWEHVVFTACHNVGSSIGNLKRLENWTDGSWKKLIRDFKDRKH